MKKQAAQLNPLRLTSTMGSATGKEMRAMAGKTTVVPPLSVSRGKQLEKGTSAVKSGIFCEFNQLHHMLKQLSESKIKSGVSPKFPIHKEPKTATLKKVFRNPVIAVPKVIVSPYYINMESARKRPMYSGLSAFTNSSNKSPDYKSQDIAYLFDERK